MSSTPTLDPPRPRTPHRRNWATTAAAVVLALLFATVVAVATPRWLNEPSHRAVTVQNPTDFPVNVTVRSGPDDSGTSIGTVGQRSTRTFQGIVDRGDRWIFEFSYGGVTGAQVTVSNDQLEEAVTVPDSTAEEFLAAGLRPLGE